MDMSSCEVLPATAAAAVAAAARACDIFDSKVTGLMSLGISS